jgi:hypothetical protein
VRQARARGSKVKELMAISLPHFELLQLLKSRGELPQGGSILEIGEANFYGDFDLLSHAQDWSPELKAKLEVAWNLQDTFTIAKCIYQALFSPRIILAIDADGPSALKLDLNEPQDVGRFDVVYNHGTAEHIFDIAQVFRTMHAATAVNGLMLHEAPFTGWVEHGFYCLQPTLFWDLALANDYKVLLFALENIEERTATVVGQREDILDMEMRDLLPKNLMSFVALQKQSEQPFRNPTQGVYKRNVSQLVQEAWRTLR